MECVPAHDPSIGSRFSLGDDYPRLFVWSGTGSDTVPGRDNLRSAGSAKENDRAVIGRERPLIAGTGQNQSRFVCGTLGDTR
jgi:hypothetical protein